MMKRRDFLGAAAAMVFAPQFGRWHKQGSGLLWTPEYLSIYINDRMWKSFPVNVHEEQTFTMPYEGVLTFELETRFQGRRVLVPATPGMQGHWAGAKDGLTIVWPAATTVRLA